MFIRQSYKTIMPIQNGYRMSINYILRSGYLFARSMLIFEFYTSQKGYLMPENNWLRVLHLLFDGSERRCPNSEPSCATKFGFLGVFLHASRNSGTLQVSIDSCLNLALREIKGRQLFKTISRTFSPSGHGSCLHSPRSESRLEHRQSSVGWSDTNTEGNNRLHWMGLDDDTTPPHFSD